MSTEVTSIAVEHTEICWHK